MNVHKILVATDFSTCNDEALEMATSVARSSGAAMLIVHVEEPPAIYSEGMMYYGMPNPTAEHQRRMLENLVPDDPVVRYEHRLITGTPAPAIVKLAKQEKVDLIVIGTHGRTGIDRMLVGSVAEAVLRRANCSVLTFKQTKRTPVKTP